MHTPARVPTYPLDRVQVLVREGRYQVTASALQGATSLTFDEEDVRECVLAIRRADFYKTMEAVRAPGLWQDVYRPTWGGVALYVKLQLREPIGAVVISFKER